MTTLCEKCEQRDLVSYQVEPQEAWRLVVLSRWRHICATALMATPSAPACFQFAGMRVTS